MLTFSCVGFYKHTSYAAFKVLENDLPAIKLYLFPTKLGTQNLLMLKQNFRMISLSIKTIYTSLYFSLQSVSYGKPVIKVANYNCLSSSQVNFDTTGDIKRKEKGKRKGKGMEKIVMFHKSYRIYLKWKINRWKL